MDVSNVDHEQIDAAIHAAEAKTSAKIVWVLAQTSSHTTALPIFIAAVVSLVTPWLLITFTAMTVHRVLLLQVVLFFALLLLFCVPRVRVALMPRRARRAIAHRVAMEQFANRGIGRHRPGILIFVSLAERYARIIVDSQIAARIPQSEWQSAVDALIGHMRDGRIADGFITAIKICGDELAKHFPPTRPSNDVLPDGRSVPR
jgi:putative membrane protein